MTAGKHGTRVLRREVDSTHSILGVVDPDRAEWLAAGEEWEPALARAAQAACGFAWSYRPGRCIGCALVDVFEGPSAVDGQRLPSGVIHCTTGRLRLASFSDIAGWTVRGRMDAGDRDDLTVDCEPGWYRVDVVLNPPEPGALAAGEACMGDLLDELACEDDDFDDEDDDYENDPDAIPDVVIELTRVAGDPGTRFPTGVLWEEDA